MVTIVTAARLRLSWLWDRVRVVHETNIVGVAEVAEVRPSRNRWRPQDVSHAIRPEYQPHRLNLLPVGTNSLGCWCRLRGVACDV